MRVGLLLKNHSIVKIILVGIFFDKFFDFTDVYFLKTHQRITCFFNQSKFRKTSIFVLQLFLFFLGRSIYAEDFEVHIHPSSSQLSIAETLKVDLDLVFPGNFAINLNALRQNLLRSSHFYEHPFAIQEMHIDAPQQRNDGLYTQHIQIFLRPLRVGKVYLTFYDVVFDSKDPKIQTHRVFSRVYPIEVTTIKTEAVKGLLAPLMTFSKEVPLELSPQNQSNLVDSPSLQLQQNEKNILWMDQKRLPWISILSFLIVVFVLWFFLKNPLTKPSMTPVQAELLAKKEALLQLEKLKSQQLPEKGRYEDFYTQLTQPIRLYIEKRYKLPASTSTTPEFLSEIADNPAFPLSMRQQLSQFMIQADRVKFGRHLPSIDECKQAEKMAFQFVLNEKKS